MYFCSKCFKVIYFIKYSSLVNKCLHCAIVPAKRLSARELTCHHINWAAV